MSPNTLSVSSLTKAVFQAGEEFIVRAFADPDEPLSLRLVQRQGPWPRIGLTYEAPEGGGKALLVDVDDDLTPDSGVALGRMLTMRALTDLEIAPGESKLTPVKQGFSLAWVVLSDKGSRGERVDECGPLMEKMTVEQLDIALCRGHIIPDEAGELSALLMRTAHFHGFDLILTSGGTGAAPRDVTPEATLRVLDRRLPGFEQAMMQASLEKTPHAVISRAVAGVACLSLIINLPGSPKAVRENLQAVLPALKHTIEKIQGDPSDCATVA